MKILKGEATHLAVNYETFYLLLTEHREDGIYVVLLDFADSH